MGDKINKLFFYILLGIIPIIVVVVYTIYGSNKTLTKTCGGFAGNLPKNQCPEGYICKSKNDSPDSLGVCKKELFKGFAL